MLRRVPYTLSVDLKPYIRDVPDFPQPGVMFRDITPLLKDTAAFRWVIDRFTEEYRQAGLDAIVAIESRGFIFGAPVAANLGIGLIPVRKPGKLPSARMSVEYALEYGNGQLDIHADALQEGDRVVIVDDLLATGGTAMAAAKLVELLGAHVHSFAFVVELDALGGRGRLHDYHVFSLVHYG